MRNLSQSLINHFSSEVTTLATCWKIVRKDKTTLGFTDHDQPLTIDNIVYDSIAGFTPTNVEIGSNLAVDNLDLSGQLYESKITQNDLLAGKYDFAEVEIFLVNYLHPHSGKMIQKRGVLGEVTLIKNLFYVEIRGLTQFLSQTMCESYLPHCRANLGDNRCKFNLGTKGFFAVAEVSEITSQQSFTANALKSFTRGWFTFGKVNFGSGANKELSMEVKGFTNDQIVLSLPMPFAIKEGDEFYITAGCDKSSSTCINKFNNIINFRGEPDLPGVDKLLSTIGTIRDFSLPNN